MPKDLKNVIDNIESSEKESAILLSKMDRLKEMIEKQKRVMADYEAIIEEQKTKIARMYDIPEDVLELKELVGTQRAMLNQRENDIELAKGEVLAIQKELEFMTKQNIPTQRKLEEGFELMGNLKTEIAEKKSELLLKEESNKSLQIKVREIQAFADKLQDEQVKLLSDMDQKWKKEIEQLRLDHIEEKKDLVGKITDLDTFLLDSKLISTEATSEAKDLKSRFAEIRERQENMINKLEDALDKKREADERVRELNNEMEVLRTFKEENYKKITYYDKLTELMEHEAQFKAFLIVEQVGSMSLDVLRQALGSPIVMVKKLVKNLQDIDLFEINDAGKISVKKE
jgi:DNA repair exonuclease SbcCD ATPase subunit